MSTNRRRIAHTRRIAITPAMVDWFKRGIEIQRQGKHRTWEDQGGRQREYYDLCNNLHRLLGRRPWQPCVLDDSLVDDADQSLRGRLEASLPADEVREAKRVAQDALWREQWEYAMTIASAAVRLAQIKHYGIPEELVRQWDAERSRGL
jgi:hypothetical protein